MIESLRTLFGMKPKSAKKAKKPARRTFRPTIDSLEDRRLMAVLFVDDDLQQYPAAGYTSIQAAVTAAAPGDLIKVFAGEYDESVTIPAAKPNLTLVGASTGPTFATNPDFASIVDPVAGVNGIGFNVQANNTVIRGFTVGDIDDNTVNAIGIYTAPTTSGYILAANVVTDNSIGIYAGASGARPSYIRANWIYDNNDAGPAGGTGIYSDQGARNLHIMGNTISDQFNTAINFAGVFGQQNNIRIKGNRIGDINRDDSGAAISMINTTNSLVIGNASFQSNTHGIDVAGGNVNLTVSANLVRDASWTGINVNSVYAGPNVGTRIMSNVVRYAGDSGIRLRGGATESYVFNNTVTYSQGTGTTGNGISIENSNDNVVRSNRSFHNNENGILVIGSSGNTIAYNVALFNRTFDLNEVSVLFTNDWYGNTARTRSRPGL